MTEKIYYPSPEVLSGYYIVTDRDAKTILPLLDIREDNLPKNKNIVIAGSGLLYNPNSLEHLLAINNNKLFIVDPSLSARSEDYSANISRDSEGKIISATYILKKYAQSEETFSDQKFIEFQRKRWNTVKRINATVLGGSIPKINISDYAQNVDLFIDCYGVYFYLKPEKLKNYVVDIKNCLSKNGTAIIFPVSDTDMWKALGKQKNMLVQPYEIKDEYNQLVEGVKLFKT